MNKTCQSCSMPMKKDPGEGGTNSDGTKSTKYCSLCYQNGSFTGPDMTTEDMQKLCIEKLKEMGFPRPIGWLFTRNIPKLERWK